MPSPAEEAASEGCWLLLGMLSLNAPPASWARRVAALVYKAMQQLPVLFLHTAHRRLEPWNVPMGRSPDRSNYVAHGIFIIRHQLARGLFALRSASAVSRCSREV
jgi:hypothetical protein